ncbi:hypothetical protein BGZ58_007701 [Dissophora ornata]|nr:hypothetical protein BGZ58_007701 [Dissophora ornata]
MGDRTASVVLLSDKEQQWLDRGINDKLLRHIDINDIKDMEMGVASGGFGMIHAGRWRTMRVAVKVLYNPADFIQEVGIHKLVQDSENIVKFYGITRMKTRGDYGMVLQFAARGSLRDYLSRNFESLDWVKKIRLARDVSAGIAFIHEDNICHHDLHSRNVLIDESGRALITDFGLSRYVNHANSNSGVRGVVPYISPERLKNTPFDHSSDVYSLGVIMWELTSGHPPFDRDGENFLLPFQIMRGRREEVVPGTPESYSRLYQQCWDGEPSKRPSLSVILSSLNELLSNYNVIHAEERGSIQPSLPENVPGPRSLPTDTHTMAMVSEVIPGISEPISMVIPTIGSPNPNGNSPNPVANVSPLVPKHSFSRSHMVNLAHAELEVALEAIPERLGNLKLSGDTVVVSPVTPLRPAWLQGAASAGAGAGASAGAGAVNGTGSPGGPQLSVSPKLSVAPPVLHSPVAAVHRVPYQSQEPLRHSHSRSPKIANIALSAALPEMTAVEDSIPEKGAPPPSMYPPHLYQQQQYHNGGYQNQLQYHVGQYQHYQPVVYQVQVETPVPAMNYSPAMNPLMNYTPAPVIPPVHTSSRSHSGSIGSRGLNGNSNSNSKNNWMPRDGKTRTREFFMACRTGNLEAVRWHLDRGAKVMEPYDNMSGRTPLHAAAMSDSFEVMKLLCESAGSELNLNEVDDSSQTPLHLLTHFSRNTQDCLDTLEYMLKKGAATNMQDNERRTPLMTSFILNDNASLVDALLDHGADPNIKCQENNALAEAAIRLRFQCVKVLLETDLSMSELSSLEHAMDVCYRVTESENRNKVLGLLVRWKNAEGIQKRQTLATMILKGTLQFDEKRIDQKPIARQVLAAAGR